MNGIAAGGSWAVPAPLQLLLWHKQRIAKRKFIPPCTCTTERCTVVLLLTCSGTFTLPCILQPYNAHNHAPLCPAAMIASGRGRLPRPTRRTSRWSRRRCALAGPAWRKPADRNLPTGPRRPACAPCPSAYCPLSPCTSPAFAPCPLALYLAHALPVTLRAHPASRPTVPCPHPHPARHPASVYPALRRCTSPWPTIHPACAPCLQAFWPLPPRTSCPPPCLCTRPQALYLAQMGLSGVELQAGSRKDLMSINYTKQARLNWMAQGLD